MSAALRLIRSSCPKRKGLKKVVLRHTASSPYYSPHSFYVCSSILPYTSTPVLYHPSIMVMCTTYTRAGISICYMTMHYCWYCLLLAQSLSMWLWLTLTVVTYTHVSTPITTWHTICQLVVLSLGSITVGCTVCTRLYMTTTLIPTGMSNYRLCTPKTHLRTLT